jgi:hypothetical protein
VGRGRGAERPHNGESNRAAGVRRRSVDAEVAGNPKMRRMGIYKHDIA